MTKRLKIFNKFNGKCAYCGKQLQYKYDCNWYKDNYAIDHIIPLSNGGSSDIDNLFPACTSCNSAKRNKNMEQFRILVLKRKYIEFSFTKEQRLFLIENKINKIEKNRKKYLDNYQFYFERGANGY